MGTSACAAPACCVARFIATSQRSKADGMLNLPAGALKQDTINSMRGHVPGFGETAATAQDEVLRTFFISCFQKEYQRSRILWRN